MIKIKEEHQTLIDQFFDLPPYQFALVGNLFAYILAAVLTNQQQNAFGNLLELIAQVLLTIQAQSAKDDINIVETDIENLVSILSLDKASKEYIINFLNKLKNSN